MPRRHMTVLLIALLASTATACGTGAPISPASPTPSPTPPPTTAISLGATSFEEYAVSACRAWESQFRAVGNPDTGAGSELSTSLDAAVEARDVPAAEALAAEITAELELGRQAIAVAGGWPPAAPMMTELDRVFVGFELMTAAHVPLARGEAGAIDPQAALEQSGAIEAWYAALAAHQAIGSERPAGTLQCGDLPVGP
jgi:hypothetical protein